ncbi:hypothetical protein BDZ91DRAFT_686266, partial [Kalaharituber pfeilii]
MDPFTITTGVAGLLGFTIQIGEILTAYIGQVKEAPEEAQTFLTEITAVSDVLKQLVGLLETAETNFHATSALSNVVTFCEGKIRHVHAKLVKFHYGKNLKDRLRWPFHRHEFNDVAATVRNCTQVFAFSLTIENCKLLSKSSGEVLTDLSEQKKKMDSLLPLFKNIPTEMANLRATLDTISSILESRINEVATEVREVKSEIKSFMNDESIAKLLAWYSPLEPRKRHETIQATRVKDTGNWVLQNNTFKTWMKGESRQILACYGEPGTGKTFITSAVIDHFLNQPGTRVVYMYCDYQEHKDQSLIHIIGSFIKQLVLHFRFKEIKLPESIEEKPDPRKSLDLDTAMNILKDLCQGSDKDFIFLVIDALDELNDDIRTDFLKKVHDILNFNPVNQATQGRNASARLFFTSRPHVREQVICHLGSEMETLKITAQQDDIYKYLVYHIDKDDQGAMSDKLRGEILQEIPKKAKGMFLTAALHTRMILQELTVSNRRKALYSLAPGLHSAYERTIARMQASKSGHELGMNALMWIYLAEQPLTIRELQHALSINDGTEDEDLDPENIPSKSTILRCCCGLLTVDAGKSTVRLVHYTLQEFFKLHREKYFPNGHNLIARTCLVYLNF